MKKLLIATTLLFFSSSVNAHTILNIQPTKEDTKLVAKVGYNLLNSNRIPYKMTLTVKNDKNPNAWVYYRNNQIVVTNTLIKAIDSEDELAGIIAHEISHGVDYRQGAFKGYFSYLGNTFNSKKYEYKSDKRAVDYMVKAGYNPLASIVALNKIAAQERYDWGSSHPLTTKRMSEIYEYIYTKYPQYLVQNEYKNNPIYQNFLITTKENREKLEQKVKSNSRKKVNYQ